MPTDRAAGEPSRRLLLQGTAAALTGLLAGCTGEPAPTPAPGPGSGSAPAPAAGTSTDRSALATARATESALLDRTPISLTEARRVLTAHLVALDAALAAAAPAASTPSSTTTSTGGPTVAATNRSLALGLQAAAHAHRFALTDVSGPTAALLASLAASDAVLAQALLVGGPGR